MRSSRKLEQRCLSDHLYIYLMQCYRPDHRTVSDFRKNNLKAIEKCFVDIVRIFSALGYTSVGKMYLDGIKIKGNASVKRTKDRAGFEKWLSGAEEEIATLLKEAETIDKQEDESCKTDPEQEALQKKLSSRTYLKKKIEEALEIMKEEGKEKINLTDKDANHMKSGDGYVPDRNFQHYKSGEYEKEENRYHYTNFTYDAARDNYVCPEGKRLEYWKSRTKKTMSHQWNHKIYRGQECGACQKRSLCTKTKARELFIDIREPLLQKMREKLISDEGRRKYFMRQHIIEPVFGHLKFNVGYRNFLLRGREKVCVEFKLMCLGWNLKKMLKLGIRPATA